MLSLLCLVLAYLSAVSVMSVYKTYLLLGGSVCVPGVVQCMGQGSCTYKAAFLRVVRCMWRGPCLYTSDLCVHLHSSGLDRHIGVRSEISVPLRNGGRDPGPIEHTCCRISGLA